MEYVILGLLMCSDQTIYGFNKMFKEIISLFYHASFGSLGTTLKKLELKGYVSSYPSLEHGRQKRYYQLTSLGKSYFLDWMKTDFKLVRPSLFYTKIFFMGLIDNLVDKIQIMDNMTKLVQSSYHDLELLNENVPRVAPSKDLQPFLDSQLDMLDLGLQSTAIELKWLKHHLEKLRKG